MKHHNINKDFFKLITNESKTAFSELLRRYNTHTYPFVFKMIESASLAEDLAVSIFSTIWQNRKELAFIDLTENIFMQLPA